MGTNLPVQLLFVEEQSTEPRAEHVAVPFDLLESSVFHNTFYHRNTTHFIVQKFYRTHQEVSAFVEELAGVAAAAGAAKHWRTMRCRDLDSAYGVVLQMLRRSWGMAAFRENARLVVRRLAWVQDARAPALVVNLARDRDRMGRRYENAMEHHPRSGGGAGRPSRSGGGGG